MEPRRALLIAAWVLSTAFMMAVTYRAVSLVGGSVTDQPIAASFTNQAASTSSSMAAPSLPPVTDPEFVSGGTTGATSTAPTTLPTTTSPGATTATTVPDAPTSSTTATTGPFTSLSQGGSVTVFCRGDDVIFNAAVPAAGYAAEIKSVGPDQVEVGFESNTTTWEIEVECDDGQADEEIKRSD